MTTVWLSTAQAARRLHFSKWYVGHLIRSGAIAAVKSGTAPNSRWCITEQAVDAYIARRSSCR